MSFREIFAALESLRARHQVPDRASTDLLIWWLDAEDLRAIGDPPAGFPSCLAAEVSSLRGRAGRGRLWARDWLGDVKVTVPWPETPLGRRLERCGGIVIHPGEVQLVADLPGILTDLALRRVDGSRYVLRPEHRNEALLAACAAAGFSKDRTLDEVVKAYQHARDDLLRLSEITAVPMRVVIDPPKPGG